MERPVSYYSQGARISAVLYVPDQGGQGRRLPGVVLCHGFTCIKESSCPTTPGASLPPAMSPSPSTTAASARARGNEAASSPTTR